MTLGQDLLDDCPLQTRCRTTGERLFEKWRQWLSFEDVAPSSLMDEVQGVRSVLRAE
jgi:hypothetical protein